MLGGEAFGLGAAGGGGTIGGGTAPGAGAVTREDTSAALRGARAGESVLRWGAMVRGSWKTAGRGVAAGCRPWRCGRVAGRRDCGGAARSAVKADFIDCAAAGRGLTVGVAHHVPVYVADRTVIDKGLTGPAATGEPDAAVPESVVDATVIADARTPISRMKHIHRAGVSPIAGCPEHA
jgi:hypothetical protein